MTEPNISIIVISYNTKRLTLDCLDSLKSANARIIVVDNASEDGSAEALSRWECSGKHRIVVLNSRNVGFAKANNIGLKHADTPLVMLLNSDTVVPSDGIKNLSAWMDRHPEVGICGPKLVYPSGAVQPSPSPVPTPWMYFVRFFGLKHLLPSVKVRRWLGRYLGKYLGEVLRSHLEPGSGQDWSEDRSFLSGAALIIRQNVFKSIGGLDAGYFMYLEDADFCIRARCSNWKLGFAEQVTILHYAGASFHADRFRQSFRSSNPESFRSIARYVFLNFGNGKLFFVRIVISISVLAKSIAAACLIFGRRRHLVKNFVRDNVHNIKVLWSNKFRDADTAI